MEEALAVQRAAHGAAFPALSDADWTHFVDAIYRLDKGRPVADFDPKLLKTLKAFDLSRPLPQLWPQFEAFCGRPAVGDQRRDFQAALGCDGRGDGQAPSGRRGRHGRRPGPCSHAGDRDLPLRIASFSMRRKQAGTSRAGHSRAQARLDDLPPARRAMSSRTCRRKKPAVARRVFRSHQPKLIRRCA